LSKPSSPMCVKCTSRICLNGLVNSEVSMENTPDFCPMKSDTEAIEKAWNEYTEPGVKEFARLASLQEAQCYEVLNGQIRTRLPRVEETIQFAQKMDYKKLGLVFCAGLSNEARIFNKMLENNGFSVISICCKTGGIAKEKIGIKPEEKIRGRKSHESMCNPIAQAEVMNKHKPDWVIMLGLCVGHDTLFLKYCDRPVTVLAVKDRVLGHNPLAALYLSNSIYYGRLLPKE